MEKKCPYCGSGFFETYIDPHGISTDEYACGTWIDSMVFTRSSQCFEAQLTQQADLLRRSRKALVQFMDGCLVDDIDLMDNLNAIIPALEKVK